MAVEQPKYKVLSDDGDFHIRQNEPTIIAKTVIQTREMDRASSEGFRRIASYIFGANTSQSKIEMTAPVTATARHSEKIAMTAPVSMQGEPGSYTIAFTMPSKYTLETLPKPNDPLITIEQVPGRKMAVLKYSGTWSQERMARKTRELLDRLAKEKLRPIGEISFARYDPPWTPWFMRTNEVQIVVE